MRSAQVIEIPGSKDPAQFAKAKWAWLDLIASDDRISPAAFKMAYLLASRFLNRERGYAYPPQRALGRMLGIKERQVRNLLSQLVDHGYIAVTHCGKQMPNEYRLVVPRVESDRSKIAGQTGKVTGTNSAANSGTKTAGPYQPSEQPFEEGGLQPPGRQCSTVDGSRGSRLDGAPPSQAPNREPQTFRVGGWRRNASGDHYEVLAVDVDAHTVTVRFTETGIEQTTNAPAGAVLIPSDDDVDDEIPF